MLTLRLSSSVAARLGEYVQLTKPRIAVLLVFTAFAALFVAARGLPSISITLGTILGGWLAAAGASALNQYLERDLDAQMSRTRGRPLPSGRMAPVNALLFGLGLLTWSFLTFMLMVNALAAVLALIGALYYIVVYTLLLKRTTAFNVVIGGAAGGFPVLVGWSAATGTLELGALLLFGIVFFWTPPHSWALALLVHGDYERGAVPMMPVRHGEPHTRVQIVWYSVHLIVITLLVYAAGILGTLYLISALLLSVWLLWHALRLLREPSKVAAKRLYKVSSFYLMLLFLSMMIDMLIH